MKIVADTATLYSPEEGTELGVTIIPVGVVIDGVSYKDYEEISCEEFLEKVRNGGVPKSSQPAIGELMDVFEESKEDTIVLTVGDGLSGAYQNAVGAKNSMDDSDHIHILDSKSLAGPHRYLVRKAVELKEKGFDIETVKQELQKSIDNSISFVIPSDFGFLKRSGRLTPVAAKIGSLIKIVPVLTQTADRKRIEPFAIKRSSKKAVDAIIKHLQTLKVDADWLVSVCHGGVQEKAKEVAEQIKSQLCDTVVEILHLSPALMTHGGPDCIVVQAIKK